MQAFIYGGSGSGKSEYAENLATTMGADSNRVYIATMCPEGGEAMERIARHREKRAHKGFVTLECYANVGSLKVPANTVILVECIGNMVANEMFSPEGAGEMACTAIVEGLKTIRRQARHMILVSNDVFSDGMQYSSDTENYRTTLAKVNRLLAAVSDEVVEMVCGIALQRKRGVR